MVRLDSWVGPETRRRKYTARGGAQPQQDCGRVEVGGEAKCHLCAEVRSHHSRESVTGFGSRVSGVGSRVSGFGFWVSGFGFRVRLALNGDELSRYQEDSLEHSRI